MGELEKIMYSMGYYDSDPQKQSIVKGYIEEAEEFMAEAGVPTDVMTSQRAYAIKSLWADARDKGTADELIKKDGMIVHLISQLRASRNGVRR